MLKTLISLLTLPLITFTLVNAKELKKGENKSTIAKKEEKLTPKQQEVYDYLKELEKKAENSRMFDILNKPPKKPY